MLFGRAQVLDSDDDSHAVVSICSLSLLILAVVSALGRMFTKLSVVRKVTLDDYTFFSALILCGVQTVAVLKASGNGLGQHWSGLTNTQRTGYEQSLYTADLLYIPAIVMVKLSMTVFIKELFPIPVHARIAHLFGIGVLIWGLGSEFAAAFQCNGPRTWHKEGNVCFNTSAFWKSFNTISIITDVFLVLWPSAVIYRLHTSLNRRLITIAFFACRFSVVGATVSQRMLGNREASPTDRSFDLWPTVLCAQIVQALSIFTACLLYFQPVLESLESGLMRSDDLRRGISKGLYGYKTSNGLRKGSNFVSSNFQEQAATSSSIPLRPLQNIENTTTIRSEEPQWEDGQSENSLTRIFKHTSWTIVREPQSPEAAADT